MSVLVTHHASYFTPRLFCVICLWLMALVAESAPHPRFGGTLQHAIFQRVTILDPTNYLNFAELQVASNLYEGLVKRDRFGRIISAIAQSWTHSDDYRIWTFVIARGAQFHNGKPVTATDVKQAWERSVRDGGWRVSVRPLFLIEGAEAYQGNTVEQIQGIHVLDDFHLQISLQAGDSEFFVKLTSPTAWITTQGQPQPTGTGPFHLASYSPTEIRLAANPNYVWGRPYLDALTFRYYADAREALFDFESEVLDALPLPFTEAERRRHEHLNELLIQTDAAALVYLRVMPHPSNSPTWHDVLKYAIDVDALLQLQYGATSSQMTSIALPRRYNGVKALRRLNHAGANGAQTLNLTYAPLPDNTGGALATRLQRDYLSPIGLQVDIKAMDPGALQPSAKATAIDLALLSMPISQDGDVSALELNQTDSLIPLYFLPASFLCQPKVRGMNSVWGGVLALESAWLAK
ncbi:MAG: ABC transporter substrate-binding protein [Candidatus Poribacteria bacterium]|nr:ABC transporter substrate-binding protein [Candidatus Poribacteria bacterium]